MARVRWMRQRRRWWSRLLSLESAVIALCTGILILLGVMTQMD